MSCQTPNARPYCAGVRVGNWHEDIALEEDIVRDYLDKRERGELMCQKNRVITDVVQQKVALSVSRDGNINFGDVIMVVNPQTSDCKRCSHALCFTLNEDAVYNVKDNICAEILNAVASPQSVRPMARSAFVVTSCDGSHIGEPLRYNQPFYLSTADGKKYLTSDRATFSQCALKSGHNKIWFGEQLSHLTEWQILPFDPQFRMELQYNPVPANSKIIFNHIKTNQNLCLEKFLLNTHFGKESEVACQSQFDVHRAELDTNHWMLTLSVPGSNVIDVQPPENDNPECPPVCRKNCVSPPDPAAAI